MRPSKRDEIYFETNLKLSDMKKYLIILAMLTFMAPLTSQARKAYAELLGFQKGLFSNKVTIRVDLGQSVSYWKQNDMKLVDQNGKDVVFNSMVDGMNYMSERGWEFVQAYVVTEGNQNVYHWLMTKEVNSDEDIKTGLILKSDTKGEEQSTYTLTYLKKTKNSTQWDVVKTESKKLKQEEINKLANEWKAQTNDNYDFDFQVKKEK